MSAFTNTQVTPSRMLGILRLLATFGDEAVLHTELRNLWWPRIDRNKSGDVSYFSDNIRELKNVDLVKEISMEDGTGYMLGSVVEDKTISPEKIATNGSRLFVQSLFQTDNGRNGDLGHVLAWWLAQPLSEAPTTTQELATTLRTKVSFEGLEWRSSKGKQITVNEARARQAALWLSYLGLGWEHGQSAATSSNIQPDPSTYLRSQFHRHLPKNGAGARVSEIWQSISEESPFLEGGRYAQNLERAGLLQDRGNSFTQSVSLALRRLHEEGSIQLIEQSDAASRHLRILTWGSGSHDRITHIARGPKSAG